MTTGSRTTLSRLSFRLGASMTLCLSLACSSDLAVRPVGLQATDATLATAVAAPNHGGMASAFSHALRHPAARAELHRALRQSPYTLHKVSVQQLLRANHGRKLLAGVAAAMQISPTAALAHFDALPALEMSLPSRQDRLLWKVGDELAVFASIDRARRPEHGISTTGQAVPRAAGRSASHGTLMIRPSSGLTLRFDPQPDRPSAGPSPA